MTSPKLVQTPSTRRRAWVVLITLSMLSGIGMTVVFPVMPFLVQQYLPAGHSSLSIWVGVLEAVSALCAFVASPFFGGLSDRVGRRPVIIIASFGAVVGYLIFGFGGALWVLLLGRIIQGITAGDLPAMFAYVADITPPENRAKRFGLLGALNGISFMVGPALGGLLSTIDIRFPVFVTAAAALLVALLSIFLLPESLAPENRAKKLQMENLNPVNVVVDAFRRRNLRGILLTIALLAIPFMFFSSNFSVLAIDTVHWDATQVGFLLSVIGVLDIVIQGVVLGFLISRIGDHATIAIGIIGQILGIGALVALALHFAQPWLLIVGVLMLGGFQGLTQAPLDGMLSSAAGDDEQGKVAGALQAVNSGVQMVAPLIAGVLYATLGQASPYLIGLVLAVTALVTFARLRSARADEQVGDLQTV